MKLSVADGINARAVSEIQALERSHLWPGAVARALTAWKRTVYQDAGRVLEQAWQVGCACCDPFEPREILEQAIAALNAPARRALEARVEPLDAVFRLHTIHDPQTPPDWSWWRRRA